MGTTPPTTGNPLGRLFQEKADITDPRFSDPRTPTGWLDVKRYGAKGDGVTDDSAAIQAALDASGTGDLLLFPDGVYLLGSAFKFKGRRRYFGGGGRAQLTTLKAGLALAGAVVAAEGWWNSAQSCDNPVEMTGFDIDCSALAGVHGVVPFNYWSTFRDIQVRNASGSAAHMFHVTDRGRNGTQLTNNSHSENVYENLRFDGGANGAHGFWQESNTGISNQDGHLRNSFFSSIGGHGIYLGRAAGWSCVDNHLYGIGKDAIQAWSCYATKIQSNYIEDFGQENASGGYYNGIALGTVLDTRGTIVSGNTVSAKMPATITAAQWCCYYARAGAGQLFAHAVFSDNIAVHATTTAPNPNRVHAFRFGEGGDTGRLLTLEWAGNQIETAVPFSVTRYVASGSVALSEPQMVSGRDAAGGYPSLDAAGRLVPARMPLVSSPVRDGSVSSLLTIDASSGAGNLIDLAITGNATINVSAPANHQRLTLHLLASGAQRTVTFGSAILRSSGVPGVYVIAQNTVLVVELEYLGNRPTPMWLLTRAQPSDAVQRPTAGSLFVETDTAAISSSASAPDRIADAITIPVAGSQLIVRTHLQWAPNVSQGTSNRAVPTPCLAAIELCDNASTPTVLASELGWVETSVLDSGYGLYGQAPAYTEVLYAPAAGIQPGVYLARHVLATVRATGQPTAFITRRRVSWILL